MAPSPLSLVLLIGLVASGAAFSRQGFQAESSLPAHCFNGVQDEDENGVDCGSVGGELSESRMNPCAPCTCLPFCAGGGRQRMPWPLVCMNFKNCRGCPECPDQFLATSINEGTCESMGYEEITDPVECVAAARLVFPDRNWNEAITPPITPRNPNSDSYASTPMSPQQPVDAPGCWPAFAPGAPAEALCVNPFLASAGNPTPCGGDFECICKLPYDDPNVVTPRYVMEVITEGTCQSHGYIEITDPEECAMAAQIVLPDITWRSPAAVPPVFDFNGGGTALPPQQPKDAPGCWPAPQGLIDASREGMFPDGRPAPPGVDERTLCANPFLETAGNRVPCSEEFKCICKLPIASRFAESQGARTSRVGPPEIAALGESIQV